VGFGFVGSGHPHGLLHVPVGVGVIVSVEEIVGVFVGVGVNGWHGLKDNVGVNVGVFVGVFVGVEVEVGVGVGVGVGFGTSKITGHKSP